MKQLAIANMGAFLPSGQNWEKSFNMLLAGHSVANSTEQYNLPIDISGHASGIEGLNRNMGDNGNGFIGAFYRLLERVTESISNETKNKKTGLYLASTHMESDILVALSNIENNLFHRLKLGKKRKLKALAEKILRIQKTDAFTLSEEEKALFLSLLLCISVNQFAKELPPMKQCFTSLSACASSLHSVQQAFDDINFGDLDDALIVGADALSILGIVGFQNARAASQDGVSLPFSEKSKGMLVGEGAAYITLANSGKIKSNAMGHIYGAGISCDARHPVQPDPEGNGLLEAMESALQQSGITKNNVVGIVAHGTGTDQNDKAEAHAIKTLFGKEEHPPITSVKHAFGHTMGAAGVVNVLTAVSSRMIGKLPPISTMNFEVISDFNAVTENAREIKSDGFIIVNALGFGGNNACVVVGP